MPMHSASAPDDLAIIRSQKTHERQYWTAKLAGELGRAGLYPDHQPAPGQAAQPAEHAWRLEGPAFQALLRLANGSHRRLHMVLVAAVCLLLKRHGGSSDIILAAPVLRQEKQARYVNTVLVLRQAVGEDMSFKDLLLAVRQTISEATEHQNYPLELILEQPGLEARAGEPPLCEVAVLLENIHDPAYLEALGPRLVFAFRQEDRALACRLAYDQGLYQPATMARAAQRLDTLLERALADISQPLGSLDILPADEAGLLLHGFNATDAPYPSGRTVAELFEEQAARRPEALALVSGAERLTYAELNQRANRLAAHLRTQGVGPESVVAILMDPCPELLVATLGVLKSGGAYLPLDPDYPARRVLDILEDCQAALVLTTSDLAQRFSFTSLQGLRLLRAEPWLGPARPNLHELDSLAVPDRTWVDYDRYARYIGQGMVKNTYINMLTSRGCPFGCAYCHKIWPRGHWRRSAQNIFEELRSFYELGVRRFIIIDDVFNLDRKDSARFFRMILEAGLRVELFFSGGLRGDLLDRDYIDLMVEAGTVSLALALETASPRLQRFIGKNLDLDKFHTNISYLCQEHPQVIQELFAMHGFPTETEDEARQTLEFIKDLHWVHMPYLNILRIYSQTPMEALALAHGISAEAIFEAEKLAFHQVPDTLPFAREFTQAIQTDFLDGYFLDPQRLKAVLPLQMRLFSQSEIVQKYDSYLPAAITSLEGLLAQAGLTLGDLGQAQCQPEDHMLVPDLGQRLRQRFPRPPAAPGALRVLLLDLSQHYSSDEEVLYDVFEPPLGLMYLMTHLHERFGQRVAGRLAKSRVDFDSPGELRAILEEFQPDLIGLRTLTLHKDFFHRHVALIRQWGYEGPMIAGGPYATSGYQTMLQDAGLDLAVIGEGEFTLAELVGAMLDNGKAWPSQEVLRQVPGVALVPGGRGRGAQARRALLLDEPLPQSLPADNPAKISQPHDLAYIIYTSGSTGRPKGIMEEHEAMVDFVAWAQDEFEHRPGYQVLLSNSHASAGAIQQVFPPLTSGGTLHFIDPDLRRDVPAYLAYLREHKINNIDEVPVILNLIFQLMGPKEGDELLPDLTCLSVGSEYIPIELIRQCRRYLNHGGRIINAYGQAEAASETATYHFDGQDPREKSLIGKPRRNLRVYILDPDGHLCPLGTPGELCVAGLGIARGYVNRPELSAAKFTANPWAGPPHGMLYHTGDRARWLADGNLEFLGRLDHQVQVRGHRVELAEVEQTIRRHPGVKDVVVTASQEDGHGTAIRAYYAPQAQEGPTPLDLRAHLETLLPEYMIPRHFVVLEALPLNPNGKVDRKALPEPGQAGQAQASRPPATPWELRLAPLWAQVLGLEGPLGVDDNFFALGGHSLKTTLLKVRIHQELHLEVPLKEIFGRPTLRGLAAYLESIQDRLSPHQGIEPGPPAPWHPLSLEQERLLAMQQFGQDFVGYNLPAAMLLEGHLEPGRIQETFAQLVRRHESLRTVFRLVDGQPAQVVLEDCPPHLELERLALDPDGDRPAIQELISRFIRPFDLAQAPLLRLKLVELLPGPQGPRHLLLVDMPHIVSDGVSVWVLVDEFSRLYAGESLAAPRLQYRDYARWQHSPQAQAQRQEQEAYWLGRLAGFLPALTLPTDHPRPSRRQFPGWGERLTLDPALADSLRGLAVSEGATLYMTLLAAYFLLLHKYSGQEDMVIGSPTAGRPHPDLQGTVGMFVNMLAMRASPRDGDSFRRFLGQVRQISQEAFQNQEAQFVDLVRGLGLARDPARHPIFDAVFELINISLNEIVIPGVTVREYPLETGVTPFELLLVATERPEGLDLELRGATSLWQPASIAAMAGHYQEVLAQVVADPDISLGAVQLSHALQSAQAGPAGLDRSEFDF